MRTKTVGVNRDISFLYTLIGKWHKDIRKGRVKTMDVMAVLSGESGSGKSTLLQALLDRYPDQFRCQTLTTTRKPNHNDAVHPLNTSFSEYCYVSDSTFNSFVERRIIALAQESVRSSNGYRFGVLQSTLDNTLAFDGCVVANVPPTVYAEMWSYYRLYKRPVCGIYLDVPEELAYERLLRRGLAPDEARARRSLAFGWRSLAEHLGYTFIKNPDEEGGVPHRAIEAFLEIVHSQY